MNWAESMNRRLRTAFCRGSTILLAMSAALTPLFSPAAPASECAPLPAGGIAWYPAESDGIDLAGGHIATLVNGVKFGPGVVGDGFLFDGADDFVEAADSA